MDDTIDLLKIKIEKAKENLSRDTLSAIAAVDWRAAILGLRSKYGYTFEQLSDLELETELLLCGLVNPENYSRELEKRMGISKAAMDILMNEMNESVFKKIREELMKKTEKIRDPGRDIAKSDTNEKEILDSAGIEIIDNSKEKLPVPQKLELTTTKPEENRENMLEKIEKPESVHPILAQKLSSSFQVEVKKTEHSLQNLSSSGKDSISTVEKNRIKIDPYREVPE